MAAYLVTGGCGFIGSHLCEALVDHGHSVRILDDLSTGLASNAPNNVELIRGSVADPQTVRSCFDGISGCFHLAAVASVERSLNDWLGSHTVNQSGTIAVLDAARNGGPDRPIPVVYASSAAVYGNCNELPIGETAPPRPSSPYGVDKFASELHARVASELHRVPTIGLRFFNVYGPRQDPTSPYSGVISIFCERLLQRGPIEIFGNGTQSRDFVFVADVVTSMIAAMKRVEQFRAPLSYVYNVCTGMETSIVGLAHEIGEIVDYEPVIRFRPPRSGEITRSCGNRMLIARDLDIPEPTELRSGLRATISWMRTASLNGSRIKPRNAVCQLNV